ncbi:MAG: H-NS family nucleoid-associated regulatory protein [Methylococcus sp.]
MFNDLETLSEAELANMIANAQRALKERQSSKRKEVIAKMREMAASIGVNIEIIEGEKPVTGRRGGKVAPKYRNPHDPEQTWTGRGMKPRWLQALMDQGHEPSEFQI